MYCKKNKENIPCHKKSELYFTPSVVLNRFNSKMKLGFAGCAVWEGKSFLWSTKKFTKLSFDLNKLILAVKIMHQDQHQNIHLYWAPMIKTWTMDKLLGPFAHARRYQFILYKIKHQLALWRLKTSTAQRITSILLFANIM